MAAELGGCGRVQVAGDRACLVHAGEVCCLEILSRDFLKFAPVFL
jgi:hypothetical protein